MAAFRLGCRGVVGIAIVSAPLLFYGLGSLLNAVLP
jgi:hypothetical protein